MAFKYDDESSGKVQTVLFDSDLAAWGWIWLQLGILLIVAGSTVVTGAEWARWVGVVSSPSPQSPPARGSASAIVDLVMEGIYGAAI